MGFAERRADNSPAPLRTREPALHPLQGGHRVFSLDQAPNDKTTGLPGCPHQRANHTFVNCGREGVGPRRYGGRKESRSLRTGKQIRFGQDLEALPLQHIHRRLVVVDMQNNRRSTVRMHNQRVRVVDVDLRLK